MYLHIFDNHVEISNQDSSIYIPIESVLKSIKATLKSGLPVLIKYHAVDIDFENLLSKHFIHNDDYTFINRSLKNRFLTSRKITSLTEMVDYMLELNDRLS